LHLVVVELELQELQLLNADQVLIQDPVVQV
jgi:hypothetical protein